MLAERDQKLGRVAEEARSKLKSLRKDSPAHRRMDSPAHRRKDSPARQKGEKEGGKAEKYGRCFAEHVSRERQRPRSPMSRAARRRARSIPARPSRSPPPRSRTPTPPRGSVDIRRQATRRRTASPPKGARGSRADSPARPIGALPKCDERRKENLRRLFSTSSSASPREAVSR